MTHHENNSQVLISEVVHSAETGATVPELLGIFSPVLENSRTCTENEPRVWMKFHEKNIKKLALAHDWNQNRLSLRGQAILEVSCPVLVALALWSSLWPPRALWPFWRRRISPTILPARRINVSKMSLRSSHHLFIYFFPSNLFEQRTTIFTKNIDKSVYPRFVVGALEQPRVWEDEQFECMFHAAQISDIDDSQSPQFIGGLKFKFCWPSPVFKTWKYIPIKSR